jgi:hypothetical protein
VTDLVCGPNGPADPTRAPYPYPVPYPSRGGRALSHPRCAVTNCARDGRPAWHTVGRAGHSLTVKVRPATVSCAKKLSTGLAGGVCSERADTAAATAACGCPAGCTSSGASLQQQATPAALSPRAQRRNYPASRGLRHDTTVPHRHTLVAYPGCCCCGGGGAAWGCVRLHHR